MRKATLLLATVLSALVAVSAVGAEKKRSKSPGSTATQGAAYKWVDENGVTHYGDHVPSEYSQREQTVLNEQGLVVGKSKAEMSPKEAADFAARQKDEARHRQHDMFLLSNYSSVKEIENVRDVRLDQINGQITAAEAYISSLTTRVDGLKTRALNYAPYNTKPGARRMPDDLAEEMVRAMSELRTQNSALTVKKTELQNVEAQFDADITRFKELRPSAARSDQANGPKQ